MKREDLLKMLEGLPEGTDIDIDSNIVPPIPPNDSPAEPPVDPPAEPPVDPPAEPPIKNDQTITMTAADFMRAVEAIAQKRKPNDDKKPKEKNNAEVFLY